MVTVKAVYENGSIKLLEEASLQEHQQLLITLIDDKKSIDESVRTVSLQQPKSFEAYLKDEKEDLYQDYLNLDL